MSESTNTITNTAAAPIATIASLSQHEGQTVTLRGWLYNLRASGKLLFPIFRDGTGTIQGIVPKAAVPEEVFNTLKELTLESSLTVTGKVRADSRAPSGYELDVENVEVLQRVPEETPFPITLKEHGVDFLMEHRHLWLRTPRQSAILRVRATIMRAAAEYFDLNGFVRTDPPILTPNACEGTSELFEMDYFDDDKAYLTQSGQLYVEATALALGKVYSFGPTFRAEKSKTRRHLTEFWMVEPEVAFLELDGLLDLAEAYITHIVTTVLAHHRADLKVIGKDIAKLEAILAPTSDSTSNAVILNEVKDPCVSSGTPQTSAEPSITIPATTATEPASTSPNKFPRLSYDEAHAMLEKAYAEGKIEAPHKYGDDFGSPDETYISSQFSKARHDPPLPRRHQSLLHAARPARPHQGPMRRRPRPRGLRRNHRRQPAR